MSVGTYSYFHLPLIDMLPYKVGINIAEEMDAARAKQTSEEVVLVYRNRRTGRLREFSLDDKAWHNDKRWEWVETRVESDHNGVEPMILEFYVSNTEGDKTAELLATQGKLYMLCMMDTDSVEEEVVERFVATAKHADSEGYKIVCLTPANIIHQTQLNFGGVSVPIYNIDAKTMKTMLRANYGLVELENGTIVAKYNYRDIPY